MGPFIGQMVHFKYKQDTVVPALIQSIYATSMTGDVHLVVFKPGGAVELDAQRGMNVGEWMPIKR